jgi:hypothetical protein
MAVQGRWFGMARKGAPRQNAKKIEKSRMAKTLEKGGGYGTQME